MHAGVAAAEMMSNTTSASSASSSLSHSTYTVAKSDDDEGLGGLRVRSGGGLLKRLLSAISLQPCQ